MLSSDAPTKISTPWASSGARNVIPVGSLIGVTAGAASFTDGFPPLTATDPASGGVPPDVRDVNGGLYAMSAPLRWINGGGLPGYDSTFSSAVGGYPNGAVLQSSDRTGFWLSTADSNTSNPDAGGANWLPLFYFGLQSQALSNVDVTLTAVQAAKPVIVLTGALSTNVNLIFPAWLRQWMVVNNTTGSAYKVSVKTASGTAAAISRGASLVYGDGTNILNASIVTTQSFTLAQSLTANGYDTTPGGKIDQWGTYTSDVTDETTPVTVTFPIAFPNACLNVQVTTKNTNPGDSTADSWIELSGTPTTTGFAALIGYGSGVTRVVHGFTWRAVGY